MFLKTRAFTISWKAEKREIQKFLNSKMIWRIDVNSDSTFYSACVVVFLTSCFHFFSQRVLYHFIDKIFFRRTEAIAWRCSVKWCFNSNMFGLFRGSFWGGWGMGGGDEITPWLKLVRIMLETWNFVRKFTRICSFRKYTFQYQGFLNFADVSIFFAKNQHFLAKMYFYSKQ